MLQEHQNKSDLVLFGKVFDWSVLDLVKIEMELLVGVEDVRRSIETIFEELSQKESGSLVFLSRQVKLVLEIEVFLLEGLILGLLKR